jgi:hypothetical protein
MKFTLSIAFVGSRISACCLAMSALLCLSPRAEAIGIIMPIYGNTASQFDDAIAAAQKVKMIAIINPNEGPGSKKVSGIVTPVARLRASGATVVGYVPTGYGLDSLSGVKEQIDHYVSWYGVTGVFLDEMSDQTSKLSFYRAVFNHAKGKGLFVVGNPGTFVPFGYAAVADLLVTYEDTKSNGWSKQSPSAWTKGYPIDKIGAIVYAVSASAEQGVIQRALSIKYGWIYATDGSGNDPFKHAASYLATEATYIKSLNGGKKY